MMEELRFVEAKARDDSGAVIHRASPPTGEL
jgi:hypothetical protein